MVSKRISALENNNNNEIIVQIIIYLLVTFCPLISLRLLVIMLFDEALIPSILKLEDNDFFIGGLI